MIHGRVYTEEEIRDYQNQMKGRRLFFSNLSFETTWKQVKDHMRQAGGDVVRVDVFSKESGHGSDRKSKGCGVIEFRTQEDCAKALEQLHESELNGRPILLKYDTNLHPMSALHRNTSQPS